MTFLYLSIKFISLSWSLQNLLYFPGNEAAVSLMSLEVSAAVNFYSDILSIRSFLLIMVALWNRADHYIFALLFFSFFFSSPNLSHHRLDGCHTSTHGVALVRI